MLHARRHGENEERRRIEDQELLRRLHRWRTRRGGDGGGRGLIGGERKEGMMTEDSFIVKVG